MSQSQFSRRGSGTGQVVTLSPEIDITNACVNGAELASALVPGVTLVVADMTGTTFCDCRGVRMLAHTCTEAAARGVEVRVAAHSIAVLRVFALTQLDHLLPVYPQVPTALR